MQVRSGVDTYDLAWNRGEPLSVHVLETDAGTVLFGTGDAYTAEELAQIARRHEVAGVVVEHGDVDHYEGVPVLREALGEIEVGVPVDDAASLADAGVLADCFLEAGDRFFGVLAIGAPGHTPGNMAYRHDGILVAGDTVAGVDSQYAAPGDWSGPLAPMTPDYNADDAQARESILGLLEYDSDVVLVTHGSSVREGGYAAVQLLVDDLGR